MINLQLDLKLRKILPEFASEHTCIFVVGQGTEVLSRNRSEGWEKKVGRCSQCGECCVKGDCGYIILSEPGKTVCGHPDTMPWPCVRGSGEDTYGCTVKFKKVK